MRRKTAGTLRQSTIALVLCSSLLVCFSSALSANARVSAEMRDEVSHRSLRVFAATPLVPHDSPSGTDSTEGSTHGGDTRDFGFGPSVMRNPGASTMTNGPSRSRANRRASLLEVQSGDGPLQPTTQGSGGSGDESKHGGDTRDYGFGPGVMLQIKEDGSSNSAEKKSGGDTHDFGFGVGVMVEVGDDTNSDKGESSKSGGDTHDFGFGPSVMLEVEDDSNTKGDAETGEKKSGGDTHDFGFGVGVMLESKGKIKPVIPNVKIQYEESSTLENWKKAKAKGKASGSKINDTNPFIRQQDAETLKPVSVIPKNANDIVRQLALNPHAYKRECPVSLCPGNMKCPHEGGSCCKHGSLCCPMGSSCINSDPPMCVLDTKADPNLCDYQQCDRNYSCPFSGVPICCLGGNGRSCCDVGYSCVAGDPPSCQKLTPAGKMLQLDEFTKMLKQAAAGKISLLRPHNIKKPKKTAVKKTKKPKKAKKQKKKKKKTKRTKRKHIKKSNRPKHPKRVHPKKVRTSASAIKQATKAAKQDETIKIGAPAASGKKEGFLYGRGKAKAPSSA